MNELKNVIAGNIIELRKTAGITQAELAQRLNYTDKAVSKWERGESIPDVTVLKSVADNFGVTVDYLLSDEHIDKAAMQNRADKIKNRNHLIITLLSAALVWLIATVLYVIFEIIPNVDGKWWMAYVYAVPVTCIVLIVFNSLWGKRFTNFARISALVWSILVCLYLTFATYKITLIFVIGIPAQIIIFLWAGLKPKKPTPTDK
ncbi:MAG: helix-turn-helix transcriptional regulator [Ruminococcaceae bacterium]|nr:helix-turn-helix transcriptional regulator [Oscillospiraceae bacterium]